MRTPLAPIPQCTFWRAADRAARDNGQDLVEYALLLMLIAIIVVGSVALLGESVVSGLYEPVLQAWPS